MKLLFIINPKSGKNNVDYNTLLNDYFKNLSHEIELFELDGRNADTIPQLVKDKAPDRVVAVGGDGTITLVAKHLKDTEIPMGILPGGSANGMAKELDIPLDMEQALDIVINGSIKCSDLISVNNQLCLHLSDIGLNAQLVKYFEKGNMRGKIGYARFAIKVLWRKRLMQISIESEGKQIKRDALMVVLANASKYGTGAVINPGGDLYDGLFEVVIVRRLALSELFKMWIKPQPFNKEKIEVFKASSVEIETKKKVHFQVDGEYLGKVKRVKAHILPAQLNLILPNEIKRKLNLNVDKKNSPRKYEGHLY